MTSVLSDQLRDYGVDDQRLWVDAAGRLMRPGSCDNAWAIVVCKQRVETRLGDEVGDNGTRLPAPSLDVRGPLACASIARAGTVAGPDKAEVS